MNTIRKESPSNAYALLIYRHYNTTGFGEIKQTPAIPAGVVGSVSLVDY